MYNQYLMILYVSLDPKMFSFAIKRILFCSAADQLFMHLCKCCFNVCSNEKVFAFIIPVMCYKCVCQIQKPNMSKKLIISELFPPKSKNLPRHQNYTVKSHLEKNRTLVTLPVVPLLRTGCSSSIDKKKSAILIDKGRSSASPKIFQFVNLNTS